MKKRKNILSAGLAKRLCSGVVAAAMTLSMVSVQNVTAKATDTQKSEEQTTVSGVSLSNPRVVADSSYQSGQRVTYDCVYFGSYPQAEVVASEADETTVNEAIRNGDDYVVDNDLYVKLQSAVGWDSNGDITIEGEKYRRLRSTDATSTYSLDHDSAYYSNIDTSTYVYDWRYSEDTYHYFRYQPIKWRVLSVDGSTALLIADVALDCQTYNLEHEDVTWGSSTIRSFLNSYDSSANHENMDYSNSGFLGVAFTVDERLAIEDTTVISDDDKYYSTECGKNTTDKIFLLTENEAYGDSSIDYGFINKWEVSDEAKRVRSSTYSKAMGCASNASYTSEDGITIYDVSCDWWLRSTNGSYVKDMDNLTTYFEMLAGCIWGAGNGGAEGYVNNDNIGVRPVLNFNLASSNLLTDAGTYTTESTSTVTAHEHSYIAKVTRVATCTKEGVTTYTCACGASYTKAISKTAHKNSDWTVTKKATASADGQKVVKCTTCGTVIQTGKVAKPASVALNTSKIAYDGKVKTPAVTVRDSAGMDISASDYSVSYKNNKNPGTATVTVTFKGNTYAGTLTGKFTITKEKQTIKTAKLKTYKAKSLKTKKAVVNLKAKATGKGKLTYKVSKYPKNAKKYITVSKKGVVTLKKGAKKGTYKITVTAAATGTYAKATKTVTIKVK